MSCPFLFRNKHKKNCLVNETNWLFQFLAFISEHSLLCFEAKYINFDVKTSTTIPLSILKCLNFTGSWEPGYDRSMSASNLNEWVTASVDNNNIMRSLIQSVSYPWQYSSADPLLVFYSSLACAERM